MISIQIITKVHNSINIARRVIVLVLCTVKSWSTFVPSFVKISQIL